MSSYLNRIILFLLLCTPILAEHGTPETYLNLARDQQDKNDYELTLFFLNNGIEKYPQEASLYFERGNFYLSQRIYKKALHDFLLAQKYHYDNTYPLYTNIAEIYSLQGNYKDAKKYYIKLVKNYPDNEHAAANLLWYYYKTLQIKEGIQIGEAAIAKWPDSSSINSMLALLYASVHDYEKAQSCYERAVNISIAAGRYREASQTLYNQAIFESEFYQFAKAEALLQKAIGLDSNPSSYRLLGEIYLKKLFYFSSKDMIEISESLEIEESEKIKSDRTPLGRLVLAELYLTFYQLDQAKKILDEVAQSTNQEWITGFGTNKEAYLSWMYKLQANLWEKYLQLEKRTIVPSFGAWIKQQVFRLKALFFQFYYKSLQSSFTLQVANDLMREHLLLPAYQNYMMLSQDYQGVERRFINMSRNLKLSFAPKAEPSYLAQKSLLDNDPVLREIAYQKFDPIYEKSKQQNLLEKWLKKVGFSKSRIPLIVKLYQLNRAAVTGYGLPVVLSLQGDKFYTNTVQKLLKQNLILTKNTPYMLNLVMDQGQTIMFLYENGSEILSRTLDYHASKAGLVDLANRVLFYLYFPTE